MKEDKILRPYFSHDYTPLEDKNLLKLDIAMGNEGYGLYWKIVEYMHQNDFLISEEDLLAYKFRTEVEKIHRIMNDFDLFRIENDCYISDRILRNLNYVEQKNEDKKKAANVRWLLSSFNKAYTEFFGQEPILTSDEIEALKKYDEKIPELRSKLRDIIYTMKGLKFNTDVNFKPCANWLLKDNNLARIVNGEFGALKHKKTEKELKDEQRQLQLQEAARNQPSELELKIEKCSGKAEALEIISDFYKGRTPSIMQGKLMIIPNFRTLMTKFDITNNEVIEKCQH